MFLRAFRLNPRSECVLRSRRELRKEAFLQKVRNGVPFLFWGAIRTRVQTSNIGRTHQGQTSSERDAPAPDSISSVAREIGPARFHSETWQGRLDGYRPACADRCRRNPRVMH